MTKVTVLLTSDKETLIALLGDAVENTPSLALDIKPGSELPAALAELEEQLKKPTAPIMFIVNGGGYSPEAAAQYSPEKVAEFTVDNPALDEFVAAVA